jgi:hypothetical protein
MAEKLTIMTERVDDIPLLLAQLERMGVQPLLDEHFPTHGNWVGLSLGWVTVIWLTHILSEANHRLNQVEPWAMQRLQTLRGATGQRVHPLDLSDDRLAAVLEAWSDDGHWQAFEGAWTQQLLRVYDLQPERVRLDATTASGYWRVTEDGLFQFGPSKDHRPDWPQVKVLLSVLDPLGLPVATDSVPGPRAFIQAGGDAYLCPLAEVQLPRRVLEADLEPVSSGLQPLTRITRLTATGARQPIADAYERLEPLTAAVAGTRLAWAERRLVVRSRQLARAGERALRARVAQARAAVAALNTRGRGKPRFTEQPALQAAVEATLLRHRVHGRLAVPYTERVQKRPRRRYGSRPATVQVERDVRVTVVVDRPAVTTAIGRLGWRVYATNAPSDQLPLAPAVLAYRSQ